MKLVCFLNINLKFSELNNKRRRGVEEVLTLGVLKGKNEKTMLLSLLVIFHLCA